MEMTKNGIAKNCWKTYQIAKDKGVASCLVPYLAEAIYLGAVLEKREERENAAENTFSLSQIQASFLAKNEWVKLPQRLQFAETTEDAMRAMSGAMVARTRMEAGGEGTELPWRKILLDKSDGETDFTISADDPSPHLQEGQIYWIAEPFIPKCEKYPEGALVSCLSPEERVEMASLVRPASNFPMYLQRRRAKMEKITVATDWRSAWLEYSLREIEPYNHGQAGMELAKLREELGLEASFQSGEEESQGEIAMAPDSGNEHPDLTKQEIELIEE